MPERKSDNDPKLLTAMIILENVVTPIDLNKCMKDIKEKEFDDPKIKKIARVLNKIGKDVIETICSKRFNIKTTKRLKSISLGKLILLVYQEGVRGKDIGGYLNLLTTKRKV